eukprot:scaffold130883_cov32-Tisochrysis_lutea.AAC.1
MHTLPIAVLALAALFYGRELRLPAQLADPPVLHSSAPFLPREIRDYAETIRRNTTTTTAPHKSKPSRGKRRSSAQPGTRQGTQHPGTVLAFP